MNPVDQRLVLFLRRSEEISERLLELLYFSLEYDLDDADLIEIETLQRQMLLNHIEAFRLN